MRKDTQPNQQGEVMGQPQQEEEHVRLLLVLSSKHMCVCCWVSAHTWSPTSLCTLPFSLGSQQNQFAFNLTFLVHCPLVSEELPVVIYTDCSLFFSRLLEQISPVRSSENSRESLSTSTTEHSRDPLGHAQGRLLSQNPLATGKL